MTVYDLKDEDGRIFAFEIKNIGRQALYEIVCTIPNAHIIRAPKLLSEFKEDEFCEFEIDGQKFRALEPFGDNSRYWIGPEPPKWCKLVELVREAFISRK